MKNRYQVFISFKHKDEFHNITWDRKMGEKIYEALNERGIDTFFSPASIPKTTASDYMNEIDQALDEAHILIALASKPEYLDDGWVQHEVQMFLNEMISGRKDELKKGLFIFKPESISESDFSISYRNKQMYSDFDQLIDVVSRRLDPERATEDKKKFEYTTELLIDDIVSDGGKSFSDSYYPEPGEIVFEKYKIINKIAEGGTGYIYLAHDDFFNKTYAVKVFRDFIPAMRETMLESMKKEYMFLEHISSKYVPRVYESGFVKGECWGFVSDYVEGENLKSYVENNGALSADEVINIARQLCEVLSTLHQGSPTIIYRDLKPANIIYTSDAEIRLVDFGTARLYKENQKQDTILLGTRGYAPPEQYGGLGQTDNRTDIFSLGMTLYYLITGISPQDSVSMNTLFDDVVDKSFLLACIIEHCTELDVGNRYQDVEEIINELRFPDAVQRRPRIIYNKQQLLLNQVPMSDHMEMTGVLMGTITEPLDEMIESIVVPPVPPVMPATSSVPVPPVMPAKEFAEHKVDIPEKKDMIAYFCFTNPFLEDRPGHVHAYIGEANYSSEIERITLLHSDYEKIVKSKVFSYEGDGDFSIDIECDSVVFDCPKDFSNIMQIKYACCKLLKQKSDISTTMLKFIIKSNETVMSETEVMLRKL